MVAADLLQHIDFPFTEYLFPGPFKKVGNSLSHLAFDPTVCIDKLPPQTDSQLAAYMAFATPHHAYKNYIALNHTLSLLAVCCTCNVFHLSIIAKFKGYEYI